MLCIIYASVLLFLYFQTISLDDCFFKITVQTNGWIRNTSVIELINLSAIPGMVQCDYRLTRGY